MTGFATLKRNCLLIDQLAVKLDSISDITVNMNPDSWSSPEAKCVLDTCVDTSNWIKSHTAFLCDLPSKFENIDNQSDVFLSLQNINQGNDDREIRLAHSLSMISRLPENVDTVTDSKDSISVSLKSEEAVDIALQLPLSDIINFSWQNINLQEPSISVSPLSVCDVNFTVDSNHPKFTNLNSKISHVIDVHCTKDGKFMYEYMKLLRLQLLETHSTSQKCEVFMQNFMEFDHMLQKIAEKHRDWCIAYSNKVNLFIKNIVHGTNFNDESSSIEECAHSEKTLISNYSMCMKELSEMYDDIKTHSDKIESLQKKQRALIPVVVHDIGVNRNQRLVTLGIEGSRLYLLEKISSDIQYVYKRFLELYNSLQSMNNICTHDIAGRVTSDHYTTLLLTSVIKYCFTLSSMAKCLLEESHESITNPTSPVLSLNHENVATSVESLLKDDLDMSSILKKLVNIGEKIRKLKMISINYRFVEPLVLHFLKYRTIGIIQKVLEKSQDDDLLDMKNAISSYIDQELFSVKRMLSENFEEVENHIWRVYSLISEWYCEEFPYAKWQSVGKRFLNFDNVMKLCAGIISLLLACQDDYMMIYHHKLLNECNYDDGDTRINAKTKHILMLSKRIYKSWLFLCDLHSEISKVLRENVRLFCLLEITLSKCHEIFNLESMYFSKMTSLEAEYDRHSLLLKCNMIKNSKIYSVFLAEQILKIKMAFMLNDEKYRKSVKDMKLGEFRDKISVKSSRQTNSEDEILNQYKTSPISFQNSNVSMNDFCSEKKTERVNYHTLIDQATKLIDESNKKREKNNCEIVQRLDQLFHEINNSVQIFDMMKQIEQFTKKLRTLRCLTSSKDPFNVCHVKYWYIKLVDIAKDNEALSQTFRDLFKHDENVPNISKFSSNVNFNEKNLKPGLRCILENDKYLNCIQTAISQEFVVIGGKLVSHFQERVLRFCSALHDRLLVLKSEKSKADKIAQKIAILDIIKTFQSLLNIYVNFSTHISLKKFLPTPCCELLRYKMNDLKQEIINTYPEQQKVLDAIGLVDETSPLNIGYVQCLTARSESLISTNSANGVSIETLNDISSSCFAFLKEIKNKMTCGFCVFTKTKCISIPSLSINCLPSTNTSSNTEIDSDESIHQNDEGFSNTCIPDFSHLALLIRKSHLHRMNTCQRLFDRSKMGNNDVGLMEKISFVHPDETKLHDQFYDCESSSIAYSP